MSGTISQLIDRPVAKFTSAIAILGTLGLYGCSAINGITIEAELLAAMAAIGSSAATFLFISESKQ